MQPVKNNLTSLQMFGTSPLTSIALTADMPAKIFDGKSQYQTGPAVQADRTSLNLPKSHIAAARVRDYAGKLRAPVMMMAHGDEINNSGVLSVTHEHDENITRKSRVLEKILKIESGFLDEAHPVSIYVNSRIKWLFPDEPLHVQIAVNEDEPNALSLPTGTIVINKGLLKLLETQDELDVILASTYHVALALPCLLILP